MKYAMLLAAALLLGGGSAEAQHHGHAGHGAGGHQHGAKAGSKARRAGPAKPQTQATREYIAGHHKMMAAMNLPYTGDPDADFRIQMIPHHQGAIDMARVAMRHAKDPWTRQLAEAIIVEQQREIRDMQIWLARRGFKVPEGGQPRHIIGWDSYRSVPQPAGSLGETQGSSAAPGSGVPRQR